MRMLLKLALTLGLLARLAADQTTARPPFDAIVGTWRGTSICSDRQSAPACNDGQVVYDIATDASKPDAVKVKMDKIVDGKREPMGELDFTYDPKAGNWTAEFKNPRVHSVWRLAVDGATMTGTGTLVPSGTVVRKMNLTKDR